MCVYVLCACVCARVFYENKERAGIDISYLFSLSNTTKVNKYLVEIKINKTICRHCKKPRKRTNLNASKLSHLQLYKEYKKAAENIQK